MKLVIAIVHPDDAPPVIEDLADKGVPTTRLDSHGGFLRRGNTTLMCGVDDERVDTVMEVLRARCKTRTEHMNPIPPLAEPGDFLVPYPVQVEVGGAVVFVVDVARFERL